MNTKLERLRKLTEQLTRGSYLEGKISGWECILDAIPECICIVDADENVKFINKLLQLRLNVVTKSEVYVTTYSSLLKHKAVFCTEDRTKNNITTWCDTSDVITLSQLNGNFKEFIAPIYSEIGKLLGHICVLWEVLD